MMVESEPIIFRVENKDGHRRIYCIGGWPARTAIAASMLDTVDASMVSRRGDEFVIIVANGSATYKRCTDQPSDDVIELELCSSAWRPASLLERVR